MSVRDVAGAVKDGWDCVFGWVEDCVWFWGLAFAPPAAVAGGVEMPFASGSAAGEAMVVVLCVVVGRGL